jgi:hypothetical protein
MPFPTFANEKQLGNVKSAIHDTDPFSELGATLRGHRALAAQAVEDLEMATPILVGQSGIDTTMRIMRDTTSMKKLSPIQLDHVGKNQS